MPNTRHRLILGRLHRHNVAHKRPQHHMKRGGTVAIPIVSTVATTEKKSRYPVLAGSGRRLVTHGVHPLLKKHKKRIVKLLR